MKNFMLFLIFVLSHGLLAAEGCSAQGMNYSELEQLAHELKGISDLHEMNCVTPRPTSHAKVFLFDGDMGFCPKYFRVQRPHFATRTKVLSDAERIAMTEVTPKNAELLKRIQKTLSTEDALRNCLLVKTVLTHLREKISEQESELYYYSKRGEVEAAKCATTLAQLHQNAKVAFHLRAVAYSMGSEAVMRFSKLLLLEHLFVERIQSLDPVGRNVNWTTGVITTEDNSLFKVPENVGEWINFFQKQDRYSLLNTSWIHLGIRGSRVTGAKLNQEILAGEFENEQARRKGHVHILAQPAVLRSMEDVF
ncbi:MAG: hypothetical protein H7333_07760 [Bdellovibrionales bacterium]|nr:hypothetical protein [Oligoflexia bacterium]